jgi:predicted metal-binding membrane protein
MLTWQPGISRHRWFAVPLSSNCTTWALSAVDMSLTPSTLPLFSGS